MPNLYDYMAWRGDLAIERDGFNQVDNLILSAFSYVPLDGLVPGDSAGSVSIGEAAAKFADSQELWKLLRMRRDKRFFEEIGRCPRFARLPLFCHTSMVDPTEEKQFCAVSVKLGDGSVFVSYRGTDNTLVGWKEDFNMSFLRRTPAQAQAVEYLEQVASSVDGPLRLGGHSKGGNLAVYAASFCSRPVRDRILAVYNNDGPWLHSETIREEGYQAIREKIHAYIPQSSIIGMLLEHEERYTVVRSNQKGLFQHDFYSWEVLGPRFVCLAEVTNGSKFVDHTIKSWLADWDEKQRAVFVDALYRVISATGASTFQEMGANWYSSTLSMLKTLVTLDKEVLRAVGGTLKLLMKAAGKHLPEIAPDLPLKKRIKE